jgi:hypothetical protein
MVLAAVRDDEVGVGHGEERVDGAADVGGVEPHLHGLGHHVGQLQPTEGLVHLPGQEPGVDEHLQRRGHLRDEDDLAVRAHVRLVRVRLLVVRREVLGGDGLAQLEHRVERLAGVLGEALTAGQRAHVQPLVQQELEVTTGQDQGRGRHGPSRARTTDAHQQGAGE